MYILHTYIYMYIYTDMYMYMYTHICARAHTHINKSGLQHNVPKLSVMYYRMAFYLWFFLLEIAVWHAYYSKEAFTFHKMLTPPSHIFLEAVKIHLFLHGKLVVRIIFLFIQLNESGYNMCCFQVTGIIFITSLRISKILFLNT